MHFELFALLLKELPARRNVSNLEEAVRQHVPSQSLNYSKIIFKKKSTEETPQQGAVYMDECCVQKPGRGGRQEGQTKQPELWFLSIHYF